MKKIALLGMCFAIGIAASAQKSLVKEVGNAAKKDGVKFSEIVNKMTPAFSNPETANSAEARLIVGQAGFKQFDDQFKRSAINGSTPADTPVMAEGLLGGYEYMTQVFALDSLPDEKGKIKPKHSDKAAKEVANHYFDFQRTGINAYQNEDYDNASRLWEVFLAMPSDARFNKHLMPVADSVQSEFYKYQAFSYYLNPKKDLKKALESVMKGARLTPTDKDKYDLAIQFARELGDPDVVLATAKEALAQFPTEGQYHLDIIQIYLNKNDLDAATKYIDDALASDPNDGQLYFAKGIILDNQDDLQGAIALYEKALELTPDFARALFNHANARTRLLGQQQDAVSQQDYAKFKRDTFIPTLKSIKAELEQAMSLVGNDKDLARQIDSLLDNVCYNLGE